MTGLASAGASLACWAKGTYGICCFRCVMHGLLSAEDAEEWVRQNKGARLPTTPIKAAANGSSRATSNGNSSRGAVKRPSCKWGCQVAVVAAFALMGC
jgi:hypothetical protein